jgi:hypothetical protein
MVQVEKEETVFYAAIKWLQARLHTTQFPPPHNLFCPLETVLRIRRLFDPSGISDGSKIKIRIRDPG